MNRADCGGTLFRGAIFSLFPEPIPQEVPRPTPGGCFLLWSFLDLLLVHLCEFLGPLSSQDLEERQESSHVHSTTKGEPADCGIQDSHQIAQSSTVVQSTPVP